MSFYSIHPFPGGGGRNQSTAARKKFRADILRSKKLKVSNKTWSLSAFLGRCGSRA